MKQKPNEVSHGWAVAIVIVFMILAFAFVIAILLGAVWFLTTPVGQVMILVAVIVAIWLMLSSRA